MTHAHFRQYTQGMILLLALIFAGIFATVGAAFAGHITAYDRAERSSVAMSQALALAEGALDDAAYQLNQDPSYSGQTNTPLGNGTFTITISAIDPQTKQITATGYIPDNQNPIAIKIIKANVGINNSTIAFHYGIQSGQGGFTLENTSSVTGNIFSSGSVIGSSQNYIYGDVISAGPNGLVYGIHATSSVYAHTIGNASRQTIVDKNAYYATTKTNTTVAGTAYPNSADQATTSLPISDAQIGAWESEAAAGGTAVCTNGSYNITSGTANLGPIKIPCDLYISGSSVVTVHGHIWAAGNITIQNSAVVKMASELGNQNVAIIADNPSNQLTSSTIRVQNTATFQNSGTAGSFVFLISQNRSAEMGGGEEAIELTNSASALIAYAAHGLIPLANSVSLKEVTAYQINLKNSANVKYDTGLSNTLFESGPGGSWNFIPGTYAIVR